MLITAEYRKDDGQASRSEASVPVKEDANSPFGVAQKLRRMDMTERVSVIDGGYSMRYIRCDSRKLGQRWRDVDAGGAK